MPKTTDRQAREFERADFDLTRLPRADVRFGREPKASLAVRFDPTDLDRLRAVADDYEVGVTQLVREWVLDRLSIEEGQTERDVSGDLDSAVVSAHDVVEYVRRSLEATLREVAKAQTSANPSKAEARVSRSK